jgi:hypothetical protein
MGGGGGDAIPRTAGDSGSARPVGTWIIRGDEVEWEPAVDATQIALRGMLVAIIALLVLRSMTKALARR